MHSLVSGTPFDVSARSSLFDRDTTTCSSLFPVFTYPFQGCTSVANSQLTTAANPTKGTLYTLTRGQCQQINPATSFMSVQLIPPGATQQTCNLFAYSGQTCGGTQVFNGATPISTTPQCQSIDTTKHPTGFAQSIKLCCGSSASAEGGCSVPSS